MAHDVDQTGRPAEQGGESRLAMARSSFEPIERFLSRLGQVIARDYDPSSRLERREDLHEVAQGMYEIRYSLRHADETRLSLTFIITGDKADLILLQGHQRSSARNLSADPGAVDQHVYRVDEFDDLEAAIREKVTGHLSTQHPDRTIELGD